MSINLHFARAVKCLVFVVVVEQSRHCYVVNKHKYSLPLVVVPLCRSFIWLAVELFFGQKDDSTCTARTGSLDQFKDADFFSAGDLTFEVEYILLSRAEPHLRIYQAT